MVETKLEEMLVKDYPQTDETIKTQNLRKMQTLNWVCTFKKIPK